MSTPNRYLSGTRKGKAPVEKSKFAQTCNRLSLFLKEKGNLRDFSFAKFDPNGLSDMITPTLASVPTPTAITTSVPTPTAITTPVQVQPPTTALTEAMTYNLLNNMEYNEVSKVNKGEKRVRFLPQYIILDEEEPEDSSNKASSSKPKTAQMTIFYDGKVVVLDDVPEDRAKIMMTEASGKIEKPVVELASTSKIEMKDSDLPIARRASLNKFLAKRKERAIVRAPYQAHNMDINMNMSPGPSSSGNEHSFDLNM